MGNQVSGCRFKPRWCHLNHQLWLMFFEYWTQEAWLDSRCFSQSELPWNGVFTLCTCNSIISCKKNGSVLVDTNSRNHYGRLNPKGSVAVYVKTLYELYIKSISTQFTSRIYISERLSFVYECKSSQKDSVWKKVIAYIKS